MVVLFPVKNEALVFGIARVFLWTSESPFVIEIDSDSVFGWVQGVLIKRHIPLLPSVSGILLEQFLVSDSSN